MVLKIITINFQKIFKLKNLLIFQKLNSTSYNTTLLNKINYNQIYSLKITQHPFKSTSKLTKNPPILQKIDSFQKQACNFKDFSSTFFSSPSLKHYTKTSLNAAKLLTKSEFDAANFTFLSFAPHRAIHRKK